MKSWKKWLVLTGFFYLMLLVWNLPAELCWQWVAPHLGPAADRVRVADFSGPWSSGHLDSLSLPSGNLLFNDLRWSMRPLGLLAGQLRFALTAKVQGEAPVSAILSLSPWRLKLHNLQGRVPAALLGDAILPGLGLSGQLNVSDLDLDLRRGHLDGASGGLNWRDAVVSFPQPAKLGNLSLQLATESQDVVATLKDQGGPLSIEALARLKPDGTYELTGQLRPRGQLEPGLSSLVQLFGKPAADGRILLRSNGRLAPLY